MRKVGFLQTLILCVSLLAGCTAQPAANTVAVNNAETPRATPSDAQPATNAAKGQAEGQAGPDALVADLYRQSKRKSPFFQTDDRALVDRYFTKETADLIWKDAVRSKGEVGALEADPLYDAQDTDIKNFSVGTLSIGENALVRVTFENFGEKQGLTYVLFREGGGWKIGDIKYPSGHTLFSTLSRSERKTKR